MSTIPGVGEGGGGVGLPAEGAAAANDAVICCLFEATVLTDAAGRAPD